MWRAQRALACCLLAVVVSGCASRPVLRRWGVRGLGAAGAFALHEACHVALGAALGGDVRSDGMTLVFSNLSAGEHQAVAIAGNVCTGLLAEILVDTGAHRKSDLAWGAAAFHAGNSFGYAFRDAGDRAHWLSYGGSDAAWQAAHVVHATRIGGQLAWEAGVGGWVLGTLGVTASDTGEPLCEP